MEPDLGVPCSRHKDTMITSFSSSQGLVSLKALTCTYYYYCCLFIYVFKSRGATGSDHVASKPHLLMQLGDAGTGLCASPLQDSTIHSKEVKAYHMQCGE